MRIILVSLVTIGLAASAGAAVAQDSLAAIPADTSFLGVDTDRNGMVGWAEFNLAFPDMTEEQFSTADVDRDGSLSPDEFDTLQLSTGSIQSFAPAPVPVQPMPSDSLTKSTI